MYDNINMKKLYIKPQIRTIGINTEGLVAESLNIELYNTADKDYSTPDGSNSDTRRRIGGGNIWNN